MKSDRIISKSTGSVVATIEILSIDSDNSYTARITDDKIPVKLKNLIQDFNAAVDNFSLAVVDHIEEEIQAYELYLEITDSKIFHLKIEDDKISFLVKYPTVRGFIDDYPK